MLYVVVINPGDEAGFPTRPSEVHEVERKGMGKFSEAHPGAAMLCLDMSTPVPHLGTMQRLGLDRAKRLIEHGFMSLKRYQEAKMRDAQNAASEADRREYEERMARDKKAAK